MPMLEVGAVIAVAVAAVGGQAAWVRWRTPRLAEAGGPRSGELGRGPGLSLLLAGESPAAGVGVRDQDQALAGRLAAALADANRVRWQVAARSGLRTLELVPLLTEAQPAQVVVMVVGVNDAKAPASRRAFRRDLEHVCQALDSHHPGALVVWCGVPPLDRFPALPWPLSTLLGWRARALDGELMRLAASRARHLHLPVAVADAGDFADDGFHPGARGYQAWAGALAALIRQQDRPDDPD